MRPRPAYAAPLPALSVNLGVIIGRPASPTPGKTTRDGEASSSNEDRVYCADQEDAQDACKVLTDICIRGQTKWQ